MSRPPLQAGITQAGGLVVRGPEDLRAAPGTVLRPVKGAGCTVRMGENRERSCDSGTNSGKLCARLNVFALRAKERIPT